MIGPQGLEATQQLNRAQRNFVGINNNLGFEMFKATLEDPEHKEENLVFSSLSATTSLALVFLGARGVTSWEINELLRLDEMISFNPHLMYKSVTDDFETNEALDFGKPAQILSYNSLLIYNSLSAAIHLYMIRPYILL